ncbi:transcriptional regulator [Pacificimonas flava]|uniref:Transcriptional regulator n=2 Tax=Pacificimonas TaxID=1960290 RepID=A0A219B6S6_9SPHN|nr:MULTISPECIES: type II toxin-antitoxin system PrlF family antitoxin [Pacificimonas]MBZ6378659.1 type II toxin-antitoxin system PrlF family antitoxin [Pacificimonas aurantium]OWV34070.1 transcriptional regulator [Pacificimonas flava]
MILGKLTSKAQTTIPAAVRRALDLQPGDLIAYRIEAGQVVMTKAEDTGEDDTLSLFAEWSDEADRAYDAL